MRKGNTIHGMTNTREYATWGGMKSRCKKSNPRTYKNYCGRGITVCERWSKFVNFYEDMGDRPSPLHSIDRIDNDKGYCKENCRWATRHEQACNKRVPKGSSSHHRGVYWSNHAKKWAVSIWCRNKLYKIRRLSPHI